MGLNVSCMFFAVLAMSLSPAENVGKYDALERVYLVAGFPAVQMHQPTKSGNVPSLRPQEETSPNAQTQIKFDPAQVQREGRELVELTQSLQEDIQAVSQGLHPKDTTEKLKRIQKLAKRLRGEIAP